jgi:hypothetical protein
VVAVVEERKVAVHKLSPHQAVLVVVEQTTVMEALELLVKETLAVLVEITHII